MTVITVKMLSPTAAYYLQVNNYVLVSLGLGILVKHFYLQLTAHITHLSPMPVDHSKTKH